MRNGKFSGDILWFLFILINESGLLSKKILFIILKKYFKKNQAFFSTGFSSSTWLSKLSISETKEKEVPLC